MSYSRVLAVKLFAEVLSSNNEVPDIFIFALSSCVSFHTVSASFLNFKIRKISWNDFKGKVNPNLPYSAHVFWRIDYDFIPNKKGGEMVTVDVKVTPRSWVLQENKN